MATSIMLDIETLGTGSDCVVLSLGAVKFDATSASICNSILDLKLDRDQQIALGRSVDEDTISWWSQQDPMVIEQALTEQGRVSLDDFNKQLNKFLVGANEIWAQGPVFDIVILEHLYKQMSWPVPWHYWQIRDSRTLFGVHGDSRVRQQSKLHNAVEDARSQALAVIDVYKKLNLVVVE